MVIFLLGFGLIAIPKDLFRLADYHSRIKFLEWKTGENKENLTIKMDEIKEIKQVNFILFSSLIIENFF